MGLIPQDVTKEVEIGDSLGSPLRQFKHIEGISFIRARREFVVYHEKHFFLFEGRRISLSILITVCVHIFLLYFFRINFECNL